MRIVQAGTGSQRNLVVCYLIGPHLDAALRAALGPEPCIVAYVEGKPSEGLDATVERAQATLHFSGVRRLVLVGYSLGCSGVRARLLEQDQALSALAALVLIDGTHASKPAEPWQISVWKERFDVARRGDLLVIATHTQQTYVEHLTAPNRPFLATVSVLRQATGWPLAEAGPIDAPAVHDDGKLTVLSYASRNIDAPAHILQQRRALPDALKKHVRPHLDALDAPALLDQGEAELLFGADALEAAETAATTDSPIRAELHHLLRLGAQGPDVVTWQTIIGVDPDGVFGRETESVTRRWQAAHGLTADGVVGPATWSAATRPPQSTTTGVVPKTATPLGEAELADALEQGHQEALDASPSRARLACAWAHIALENGRGRAIWNNNFGNITAFGSWPGTYYVIRVAERVKRNPDVWKQIDMRFRAHPDPASGAADYWKMMNGRYASVLRYFDDGAPEGAALELSRLGYYTARADPYARTMGALYREFLQKHLGE